MKRGNIKLLKLLNKFSFTFCRECGKITKIKYSLVNNNEHLYLCENCAKKLIKNWIS